MELFIGKFYQFQVHCNIYLIVFYFSGNNTADGSVVALKYQKPPNSWELYICTEVKNRLKNSDIVS